MSHDTRELSDGPQNIGGNIVTWLRGFAAIGTHDRLEKERISRAADRIEELDRALEVAREERPVSRDSKRASREPRDLGWYVPLRGKRFENAVLELGEREAIWALIENHAPNRLGSFPIFLASMVRSAA